MAEVSALLVYVLLLIGGSYCFHRRYRRVKAAVLAGFVSSFAALAVVGFVGDGVTSPLKHLAAFLVYGFGLWIFSALLSAVVGLVFQVQKE